LNDINIRLAGGVSLNTLSKTYRLTTSALQRHKCRHMEAAGAVLPASDVGDFTAAMRDLLRRANRLCDKAELADNYNASNNALKEMRILTKDIAEASAKMEARACSLVDSPEWVAMREAVMDALEPWAEARQAVADAMGGGDDD
jgi:hypothetical protein